MLISFFYVQNEMVFNLRIPKAFMQKKGCSYEQPFYNSFRILFTDNNSSGNFFIVYGNGIHIYAIAVFSGADYQII